MITLAFPLDYPKLIEFIGGDAYNTVFMTKSLTMEQVKKLSIEKVYTLVYAWHHLY